MDNYMMTAKVLASLCDGWKYDYVFRVPVDAIFYEGGDSFDAYHRVNTRKGKLYYEEFLHEGWWDKEDKRRERRSRERVELPVTKEQLRKLAKLNITKIVVGNSSEANWYKWHASYRGCTPFVESERKEWINEMWIEKVHVDWHRTGLWRCDTHVVLHLPEKEGINALKAI